mmetsp:Transcript_17667/g.44458  ORF Transcript_17667/g.44458 Transcript_17667/m.44458 type:complete len:369 (-) Transcript_17667:2506-3612(-)
MHPERLRGVERVVHLAEGAQHVGKLGPPRGVLVPRPSDHFGVPPRHVVWHGGALVLGHHAMRHLLEVAVAPGELCRVQLPERHGKAVEVKLAARLGPLQHLGGLVGRGPPRAECDWVDELHADGDEAGQAEVADLGGPALLEVDDVLGLDVAVDDAHAMEVGHGVADLQRHPDLLPDGHRLVVQVQVVENVYARHALLNQGVGAALLVHSEELDDARVRGAAEHLALAHKFEELPLLDGPLDALHGDGEAELPTVDLRKRPRSELVALDLELAAPDATHGEPVCEGAVGTLEVLKAAEHGAPPHHPVLDRHLKPAGVGSAEEPHRVHPQRGPPRAPRGAGAGARRGLAEDVDALHADAGCRGGDIVVA